MQPVLEIHPAALPLVRLPEIPACRAEDLVAGQADRKAADRAVPPVGWVADVVGSNKSA